ELLLGGGPVLGELEAGRAGEGAVGGGGGEDAADPVGADVPVALGDEIPGARFEDQTERVEFAPHLAVGAPVAHREGAIVPERVGDRGHGGGVLGAAEPAGRVHVDAVGDAGGAAAHLRRQRGQHLELGGGQHRAEAQVGGGARQAGQQTSEERRVGDVSNCRVHS